MRLERHQKPVNPVLEVCAIEHRLIVLHLLFGVLLDVQCLGDQEGMLVRRARRRLQQYAEAPTFVLHLNVLLVTRLEDAVVVPSIVVMHVAFIQIHKALLFTVIFASLPRDTLSRFRMFSS